MRPEPECGQQRPTIDAVASERAWLTLGPRALRYATVLVGPDDAHDVFVAAFLRVDRAQRWDDLDEPLRYLLRSVTNEAKNHRRQQIRRWRRQASAVPIEAIGVAERDLDLMRAIGKLSVDQRSVLLLTYWEDMTEAAIGELLDLSAGTVHHHLTRARARLRKVLS